MIEDKGQLALKPKTCSFECFRCRFTNDHTLQASGQEDKNWYYYDSLNDFGANVFYYISGNLDDCGDEDAKRAFSSLSKEHKELKNMVDDMVDLIGCFSDEMKADIIIVAMLICAVDGKISLKEKNWIKKLIK